MCLPVCVCVCVCVCNIQTNSNDCMYVCMFYIWHTQIRKQLKYTRPKTEARRREFQTYAAISNQDRADDILIFYVFRLACTHYLARSCTLTLFDRYVPRSVKHADRGVSQTVHTHRIEICTRRHDRREEMGGMRRRDGQANRVLRD